MNLAPIFQSLFTLAFISAAGIISRRTKVLRAEDAKALSSFVYNVGLPALFFAKIAHLDPRYWDTVIVWGSILPLAVIMVLLLALHLVRIITKDLFCVLGITVVFGSNAFFGIPFFESLYGAWGLEYAVITGALLGVVGVVASMFLFSYATHKGSLASLLLNIARSPLIISIVLGIAFFFLKIEVPALFDAVGLLGKTASATAIFVLGMFIHDHFSPAILRKAFGYTLIRVAALPIATYVVILLLRAPQAQINTFLLLQSGIPGAISIAIMAERFNYKPRELTGVVILSSLFSFFLLVALYAISAAVF